jgi:cytochrome P450
MTHLTFKIISKSLFGRSTDDSTLNEIDGIVTKMQEAVVELVRKPFIKPWLRLTGKLKRTQALKAKGEQLILDVITERRATNGEHDDLLEMLMETRYEDGGSMTDRQLLDEANILMVAGHETSAMAMSWAWYLIATHPEVEQQLLNSSLDTLGDKDPSFEALRGMGYSLQVIEEVMRLYPPAWITDREPLEDEEFEGIPIKKGLDIICLIYSLHRNPKYWPEPEKFDPERFKEEHKKQHIPYAYIPFGGGPRLCIGNNFALMEMQFILSMLVRRYQFELVSPEPIELNPLVTLRPKDGIKMRIKKRL